MLQHLLLIDIDGLRADVFANALANGHIPHLAALIGGPDQTHGTILPMLSTAPSITFCAQASLFTGAHPQQHGVSGNQFFDRFGSTNRGKSRFYAFDVGDTLEVDDAIQVFTHELASNCLQTPTLYEQMAARGKTAVVAGNMYAKGAAHWIKPSLTNLGRFLKGGNLFGLSPEKYDRHVLKKLLAHLNQNDLPHIITMYFMGLDFVSHKYGPAAQADHLIKHIDPMVGELWDAVQEKLPKAAKNGVVTAVFSDHGQIQLIDDDRHALKLGFPFDREMASFFDALGLDVHDYPGEAPNCDAVLALNGGTAHVYLHNHEARWAAAPDFQRDVLPIGKAFWQAHENGRYAPDLEGALAGVLIRSAEQDGWQAPYHALTPAGDIVSLEAWFAQQPAHLYSDPVHRLNRFAGHFAGDLLLVSHYANDFYFGGQHNGVHGGLHPDDSQAVLAFGLPNAAPTDWQPLDTAIRAAIQQRCRQEGNRRPHLADLVTGLTAVTNHFWSS